MVKNKPGPWSPFWIGMVFLIIGIVLLLVGR